MTTPSKLFSRLGGLGLVCTALFAALIVLSGNQPGDGARAATIMSFYHAHRVGQIATVFVTMLFSVVFAFFLSSLRRALSRDSDGSFLSTIVLLGGAVYTTGLLLMGVVTLALVDAADNHVTGGAQTLNLVSGDAWVPVVTGLSVMALATGVAALRSQSLPKWLAWASVGVGILAVAGPLGAVAFLITPAWTLAVGIVLLRSSRQPSESVADEAASATSTRRWTGVA